MLDVLGEAMEADGLIRVFTSFGRAFLDATAKLGTHAGSDGGLSVTLFTLAVLTIFCGGSMPNPALVPIPTPF